MSRAGAPHAPTLYAESPDGVLIAYRVHDVDQDGGDHDGGHDGAADGAGAGLPPVLLVHGFASDASVTWEGTGWIAALGDARRASITLDLRGHGASDKPVDAEAYAPERLGADLVAVLDSAAVEVVDVVAYSMGNRVVSAFAASAPERVRRVVVAGAGPNELFASWNLDEARAVLLRDEGSNDPLIEQVLRPAIAVGADREALLAVIEGVAGAPLSIPGDIPVLFVAGENDPVPAGVQELARDRGADFVSIPGRDHVSTLTARTFKNAAIEFLAER
ncbi:alpha/beta fold hydrolase [Agromyces badenianii]|uniref:alpha/beta fold hydrolase n=1 Tax=Agromyces badenianii TaxID=2080742 RepID=UPI001FCA5F2C|nr:alpha/beta fold hydrolase [Agromyces badenianii]